MWESRWPSWAVRPNEPYGFRGRKAILNHAHAFVAACPLYVNRHPRTLNNTGRKKKKKKPITNPNSFCNGHTWARRTKELWRERIYFFSRSNFCVDSYFGISPHAHTRTRGEKGGRGYGDGGRGRLYTCRYTVTTRMTSALRWAAMRAILMF